MKRRDYRMLALQALFALEMNPVAPAAAMASVIHEFGNISEKDQAFLIQLIDGVWAQKEALDQKIAPQVEEWSIERLFAMDKILCRIALYEMYFAEEPLSAGIAINEAVELAKLFGEDDSPRFINGVLGAVVTEHERSHPRD